MKQTGLLGKMLGPPPPAAAPGVAVEPPPGTPPPPPRAKADPAVEVGKGLVGGGEEEGVGKLVLEGKARMLGVSPGVTVVKSAVVGVGRLGVREEKKPLGLALGRELSEGAMGVEVGAPGLALPPPPVSPRTPGETLVEGVER